MRDHRLLVALTLRRCEALTMAKKALFVGFAPLSKRPTVRGSSGLPRVAVVAFDGVIQGDMSTPCELFSRARTKDGRPAYQVRVCAHGPLVEAEHMGLSVPGRLAWLRKAGTVIVPGIDDLDRPVPRATLAAIRAAFERGARVASICTGAFVLASTGILDGLEATTHWLASPEFARRYPEVRLDPRVLYVDNGRVLTSAGAAAAFDLCLHMVRTDHGAEVAVRLAREAVMPLERSGGQSQFIAHEAPVQDGSSMGGLLQWLAEHLEQPLTLPVVARQANMSPRTLSRRFSEHTGSTPAAWIAQARVRRAQELLETTSLSVEQVAGAVGFSSAAILREHFRRTVGRSPQGYRKAFDRRSR